MEGDEESPVRVRAQIGRMLKKKQHITEETLGVECELSLSLSSKTAASVVPISTELGTYALL